MLPPIEIFKERFGPIRYIFAPMAGISDTVFRLIMREMGAQCVVSELLSAEGLVRGGKKTRDMLSFDERERPLGIQIFGSDIGTLVEAAKIVQGEGADFVDLNFGCPVKKIVCDGGGAAWLKDPIALSKLLSQIKTALRIPLTIKVRTGWDETTKNVAEVVHIAAESGVSWVAIHGRTRAQGYSGVADWDLIKEVSQKSKIPIIGNGDLVTAALAKKKIEEGFSHAVMIGRGALKNPWIFQEIFEQFQERNFNKLLTRHFELAEEKKGEARAYLSLKKFLSWYAAGYAHCSTFRASIFETRDLKELKDLTFAFFENINPNERVNDNQPFLMGGHG